MVYRARFKRIEGVGWLATFGKSRKKLTARIEKRGSRWRVVRGDGPSYLQRSGTRRLREMKHEWGEWAGIFWARQWGQEPVRTAQRGPRFGGPPAHFPGAKTVQAARSGRTGPPVDLEYTHYSDPFVTTFKYGAEVTDAYLRRQLTPLGACVEILGWLLDNPQIVGNTPEAAPILETVTQVVRRESPDTYRRLTQ